MESGSVVPGNPVLVLAYKTMLPLAQTLVETLQGRRRDSTSPWREVHHRTCVFCSCSLTPPTDPNHSAPIWMP